MLKSPARALIFATLVGVSLLSPRTSFAADSSFYLVASPGESGGQVVLDFIGKAGINNFNLVYGTEPGKYQYGALKIAANVPTGKHVTYTVNYLTPGTKYYFALSPLSGSRGFQYTTEVSSFSKQGKVTPPPVSTGSTAGQMTTQSSIQLTVLKGKKAGEVILKWNKPADFQNYHVVYGTKSGKYQYGALNVGKVDEFKVEGLKPGEKYYFALAPVKDGKAQFISQESASPVSGGDGNGNQSNDNRGSQTTGNSDNRRSVVTPSTSTGTTVSNTTTGTTTTTTSTTSTTTTSKDTDKNAKNDDNAGQNKKVKGASTSNLSFWDFLKSFFDIFR